MSDLISRCQLFNSLATVQTLGEAYGVIQGMETVDAVPVRHGRWEWDGEAFVCSACGSGYEGQPTMMGKPMFEFCPVCGADMRKDGERHGADIR